MSLDINPRTHAFDKENVGLLNLQELANKIWPTLDSPLKADVPIVLVPGFSAWARPLLGSVNYFGGFEDLPLILSQHGYIVILVSIGPLSSNRERAVEIFSQLDNINKDATDSSHGYDIPGERQGERTVVNYGGQHPSIAFHHGVQPKIARAIVYQSVENTLPSDWRWSEKNKVNFVAHSQGGNTVRYLIAAMSGVSAVAPDLTQFHGKNRQTWIKSLTTLGCPHKGTTVTKVVHEILPREDNGNTNELDPLIDFIASTSFQNPPCRAYDLQLDHWGFRRLNMQETFLQMRERIRPVVQQWHRGKDNALYDVSLEGARDLLAVEQLATSSSSSPGIYYFSLSFCATNPLPNESLTAEDIDGFFRLLRVPPTLSPPPVTTAAIQGLLQFLMGIGILPSLRATGAWIVAVVNRHLGRMGYFSQVPAPGGQIPRPDMLGLIMFPGYAMGGRPEGLGSITAQELQLNDGIVNTVSMDGPDRPGLVHDGTRFADQYMAGQPARGKYWHIGRSRTIDHADQIGVFTNTKTSMEVQAMYLLIAELGNRLDKDSRTV